MIVFGQDIRIDELIKIKSTRQFESYMYENFTMRANAEGVNNGITNKMVQ